jgi:hypothetical protein
LSHSRSAEHRHSAPCLSLNQSSSSKRSRFKRLFARFCRFKSSKEQSTKSHVDYPVS